MMLRVWMVSLDASVLTFVVAFAESFSCYFGRYTAFTKVTDFSMAWTRGFSRGLLRSSGLGGWQEIIQELPRYLLKFHRRTSPSNLAGDVSPFKDMDVTRHHVLPTGSHSDVRMIFLVAFQSLDEAHAFSAM